MSPSKEVVGVFSMRPWTAAACIAAAGSTAAPWTRSCFQLENEPDEWDPFVSDSEREMGWAGCCWATARARERGNWAAAQLEVSCFFFSKTNSLICFKLPRAVLQWFENSNEVQIF